jgi:GTP cyclohydrolase I
MLLGCAAQNLYIEAGPIQISSCILFYAGYVVRLSTIVAKLLSVHKRGTVKFADAISEFISSEELCCVIKAYEMHLCLVTLKSDELERKNGYMNWTRFLSPISQDCQAHSQIISYTIISMPETAYL